MWDVGPRTGGFDMGNEKDCKVENSRKKSMQARPGWIRGQEHWLAKLSNNDVEQIRRLHEEDGWGYRSIAALFEISRGHVRYICKYVRRV